MCVCVKRHPSLVRSDEYNLVISVLRTGIRSGLPCDIVALSLTAELPPDRFHAEIRVTY